MRTLTTTLLAIAAATTLGLGTANATETLSSNDAAEQETSYAGTSNETPEPRADVKLRHLEVVAHVPAVDENGDPIFDENGDPVMRPVWGWVAAPAPLNSLTFPRP